MISAYREAHGQSDVELDEALGRVAQRQADAMAANDALSHTVDGALPDRLATQGADRPAAVENVSAGYASVEAVLSGWRRSPPHNANLLFGPMRRMGEACQGPAERSSDGWHAEGSRPPARLTRASRPFGRW